MVTLDRALVSSYRLSIVTMSLTAAVWPQFAMQVFRGGIGRLAYIGSYVNKELTIRLHLLTFGRGLYGRLPLAAAGLLLNIIVIILF